MRIRRITVKNFRSIRNVDIQVVNNPIVILGENNSGKSNLLLALRLLLDSNAQRLRGEISPEDINDAARSDDQNWFSVLLEIGDLQKHSEVEACFKERIDTEGEETFIRIEGRYQENEEGFFEWQSLLLSPNGRFNEALPMNRRMYESLPVRFLDAVRDGERETRATGSGLLSQLLSDIDYSDVQDDVVSNLKAANSALNEGEEIRDLSVGLTEQLTPLIPGGQGDLVIVVADEDLSLLSRNFRLRIRKSPHDVIHSSLSRQGTGLQNLALISMFRHQIRKVQESKRKKTPILVIEEPEAHLHPHAQRRLYQDLCKIDTPVIITTHSPALVKHADPSSLVVLRPRKPDETQSHQLSISFPKENEKQLADLVRVDGAEVFFARVVIAVEGQGELIALPKFAEYLGCNLARDGISIINVNSCTSFEPLLRAFKEDQLDVPTIVVYDQDVLKITDPSKDTGYQLLRQAHKLGLITQAELNSCLNNHPGVFEDRIKLLGPNIRWFGANLCFEDEVCSSGYMDVIIQTVRNEGDYEKLEKYLKEHVLELNENSLSQFIQSRSTLKKPVAHAVANAVVDIGKVPSCYASALRCATLISLGGIPVNNDFELRACAAGFMENIVDYVEQAGLRTALDNLAKEQSKEICPSMLHHFMSRTEEGKAIRDNVRQVIGNTVASIGCAEFAEIIHKTEFPAE